VAEPNIFLRICTHSHTITISSDPCPPMPTHSMTCAHPCYSNCAHVIKIVECVLPAYTKSWLDRTNKRSFTIVGFSLERFLVSVFPASEKFDSDLELDAGMHKIDAHPCPPMKNNIAPMPTHEQEHHTHAHPKPIGMEGHGHGHPM
jgi:hypothetical protein